MLMLHHKKRRPRDVLHTMPAFKRCMSLDWYCDILTFLHLTPNMGCTVWHVLYAFTDVGIVLIWSTWVLRECCENSDGAIIRTKLYFAHGQLQHFSSTDQYLLELVVPLVTRRRMSIPPYHADSKYVEEEMDSTHAHHHQESRDEV